MALISEGLIVSNCKNFDDFLILALISTSQLLIRNTHNIEISKEEFVNFINACSSNAKPNDALKKAFLKAKDSGFS